MAVIIQSHGFKYHVYTYGCPTRISLHSLKISKMEAHLHICTSHASSSAAHTSFQLLRQNVLNSFLTASFLSHLVFHPLANLTGSSLKTCRIQLPLVISTTTILAPLDWAYCFYLCLHIASLNITSDPFIICVRSCHFYIPNPPE